MTVTVWPIAAVAGAPAYSGRMLRQAQSVYLAGATSTRPLGARSGVRPGTSFTTCTATSTTWTIGPHSGVMDVEVAAECGAYTYAVDAAILGAMTAAHATLPRVDILWMRVDDPPEDGTSVPLVAGGYTAGVAASTPSQPATPARCMVLAWVNVPASGGGAPTVTWVGSYAVSSGAAVPVWSQGERDGLPTRDGLSVWRLDTHRVETYRSDFGWDTDWITITAFLNGWSAGSVAPQVRRQGNVVRWRGQIKGGTALATAFTVGTGFNPTTDRVFPVVRNNASSFTTCGLVAQAAGPFQPLSTDATAVYLDGVTYTVD